MTPDRFQLLESLFHEALDRSATERDAFVHDRCADDAELRAALLRLLAADGAESPIAEAREHIGRAVHAALSGAGESPGDRIDRYILKEPIGEGGFGVVYLAQQTTPVTRQVALKVIKLGMDTRQVIARFEAERQALAMMSHPGIAAVLDAGATPTGRPYFVMELVRGEPVTEFCDRARLGVRTRLELFIQVCDAVQHAHQKGIIHRDLKPSNVLVTDASAMGNGALPLPKIIDFGIAKATGAGTRLTEATIHTEARQFVGTPEYMSPEQAGAESLDIDTRSDIYSLGVLLYELLTGTTPFDSSLLRSASFSEMQRIIQEVPPPRPSSRLDARSAAHGADAPSPAALRRQLQGDLDWIVLKCLEKERDRRYQTAHDLALDLRRYLANQPVVARPPSVRYRLRKFARRHRAPLVAAGVVLLSLVAGLASATYGLMRARQQRNMALTALTFLEDVIAAPDPNRGSQAGLTVVEALDLASSRLNQGTLSNHVEAEARIRRMLGSTYMALGLYDKAAPELDLALVLAQHAFGRASAEAGMAWNDLGELNRFLGEFDRAEAAYNEAARIQRTLPRSMATAQTFNNLGLLKQARGEFEQALRLQRRALDLRLSLFGRNDPEVATSYNNLGALSMSMGNLPAAEEYYRQALELRLQLLPPGHWRTANTQINLARVLLEQRADSTEPEPLATDAVESTRLALGEAHTQYGRALFCLALVRRAQQRPEDAERLFRKSIEVQRRATSDDHPEVAHSLTGLGELLLHQRRFADAEPVLRDALRIRESRLDPGHPLVGIARSLLGETCLGLGRLDEAETLLAQGNAIIRASPYVAPSQRRRAALRLAALARARGDATSEQRWLAEAGPAGASDD